MRLLLCSRLGLTSYNDGKLFLLIFFTLFRVFFIKEQVLAQNEDSSFHGVCDTAKAVHHIFTQHEEFPHYEQLTRLLADRGGCSFRVVSGNASALGSVCTAPAETTEIQVSCCDAQFDNELRDFLVSRECLLSIAIQGSILRGLVDPETGAFMKAAERFRIASDSATEEMGALYQEAADLLDKITSDINRILDFIHTQPFIEMIESIRYFFSDMLCSVCYPLEGKTRLSGNTVVLHISQAAYSSVTSTVYPVLTDYASQLADAFFKAGKPTGWIDSVIDIRFRHFIQSVKQVTEEIEDTTESNIAEILTELRSGGASSYDYIRDTPTEENSDSYLPSKPNGNVSGMSALQKSSSALEAKAPDVYGNSGASAISPSSVQQPASAGWPQGAQFNAEQKQPYWPQQSPPSPPVQPAYEFPAAQKGYPQGNDAFLGRLPSVQAPGDKGAPLVDSRSPAQMSSLQGAQLQPGATNSFQKGSEQGYGNENAGYGTYNKVYPTGASSYLPAADPSIARNYGGLTPGVFPYPERGAQQPVGIANMSNQPMPVIQPPGTGSPAAWAPTGSEVNYSNANISPPDIQPISRRFERPPEQKGEQGWEGSGPYMFPTVSPLPSDDTLQTERETEPTAVPSEQSTEIPADDYRSTEMPSDNLPQGQNEKKPPIDGSPEQLYPEQPEQKTPTELPNDTVSDLRPGVADDDTVVEPLTRRPMPTEPPLISSSTSVPEGSGRLAFKNKIMRCVAASSYFTKQNEDSPITVNNALLEEQLEASLGELSMHDFLVNFGLGPQLCLYDILLSVLVVLPDPRSDAAFYNAVMSKNGTMLTPHVKGAAPSTSMRRAVSRIVQALESEISTDQTQRLMKDDVVLVTEEGALLRNQTLEAERKQDILRQFIKQKKEEQEAQVKAFKKFHLDQEAPQDEQAASVGHNANTANQPQAAESSIVPGQSAPDSAIYQKRPGPNNIVSSFLMEAEHLYRTSGAFPQFRAKSRSTARLKRQGTLESVGHSRRATSLSSSTTPNARAQGESLDTEDTAMIKTPSLFVRSLHSFLESLNQLKSDVVVVFSSDAPDPSGSSAHEHVSEDLRRAKESGDKGPLMGFVLVTMVALCCILVTMSVTPVA